MSRGRPISTVLTCLLAFLAALLVPVGAAQAAPAAEDCTAVAEGRHAGTFTTAGQTHCLELPSPQGARIAALTSLGGAGVTARVELVDRNGTAQCTDGDLSRGECALTGTAPFRARVRAADAEATGPYGVHFVRTDVLQKDCPVLPAGSFADDAAAVRLETGNGVFSHCLTIPADAHSTAELLRIRYGLPEDSELFPQYSLRVIDTDGNGPSCYDHPAPGQQLRTDGLTSCSLAAGKAYTLLLQGQDAPRSHTLDRRDVTATARGCATTAATQVGAPATTGTSGANGTLRCHRITTPAAADRLRLDVRDAHDSTHTLVMDDTGRIACYQKTWACTPSGSTGYQVVTQVPQEWSLPASYRLDAWRIATATGPAPECTRAGSVAYGYGPLTGTLGEERTGVCAVLPSASGDSFRAEVATTDGGTRTPEPELYSDAGRNLCSGHASPYSCQAAGQSLFVLPLPDAVDRAAYRAQLVCTTAPCGSEDVSVATVTPTTAQSGTVATLTVTGTALGMGTTVRLTGGPAPLTATTVSVSDDARTLKATVDLRTAPAGNWNISVIVLGSQYPRGTLTVTPPAAASGHGTYKPIAPTRLMDTRIGLGVAKAKVGQGGTVTLPVTGVAGIPASGVTAVVLNVTATEPTSSSHVSVFPDGTARTSASNLNFVAGQTVPNLVVVPVVNGKVSFYNNAGSVDLIADVAGYYTTDGSGSTYKPIAPTRLMDTRIGLGVAKAKVGQGGTVTLPVTGVAGIPASGVTAVVLNVTATEPTSSSHVSVFPDGTARTSASNLNFVAGQTVPNLVVVPVVNGKVSFYNNAGSVDLIADVAGYYTTDGSGSTYKPIAPTRLMDTRIGLGVAKAKVGQGGTVTLPVTGVAGIPASGVTAVVLNVTATEPTSSSHVSVFPDGTARTSASNLNFVAGQTVPNLVVVPVVNGKVSFYNNAGSVDLIADVAGYYTT
ncbi:hypothetical protein [Streptomyces sp. 2P-4]|uniref:hypothetical protein n=1 Tax=Streptomyces sp. 2P-4 TaxID=2931974 RepID=UPI00254197E0|nr:hypothetical protein [Streptomyces sp. 2P-4]